MTSHIRIETSKDSRFEGADGTWCTLWGYVFEDERAAAVYYVRWNDTSLEEAEFIVSIGDWAGSEPLARRCVALLGRKHEDRLSFMLVDAQRSSFHDQAFLGKMQRAVDVRGTALAGAVFRVLDELLVQDERVAALRARLEE